MHKTENDIRINLNLSILVLKTGDYINEAAVFPVKVPAIAGRNTGTFAVLGVFFR